MSNQPDSDWSLKQPDQGTTAFIQWKGTNVCMGLTCLNCQVHLHVDADFAYYVRCAYCNHLHVMSSHVPYQTAADQQNEPSAKGD